ncbi:DUF6882 domain-containing protein [Thioclava sp. GXIMD4215]|uniref:DUF6882 domain-containing protein n=1 Tax=Thioclava sp. GXIMD4215 TaxID=3131928 RepID=UPI0032465409
MPYPLNDWQLPPVWRVLFRGLDGLDQAKPLYGRLCALAEGGPKVLDGELVKSWNVEQDGGRFTAALNTGDTLEARVAFLGTHDGQSFLWADANPSLHAELTSPATMLRGQLPQELALIGPRDANEITYRDAIALLGLAAEHLPCDLVYPARSNGRLVLMVLSEAQLNTAREPSFLKRLLTRPRAPTVAEQLAALRRTVDQALNQWQQNLLPFDKLCALEPLAARAHAALIAGNAGQALAALEQIKAALGRYAVDQEPTGWVYFAEGIARLAVGNLPRARAAFAIAERAILPEPKCLILLAQARAAEPNEGDHFLKSAYLSAPAVFAAQANEHEQTQVRAALAALAATRADLAPEGLVKNVIAAFCDFERAAFARHQAAIQFRQERHVLCEADEAAKLASNKAWVDLLLTWATPGRATAPSSLSSDPHLAPDRIEWFGEVKTTGAEATVTVGFRGRFAEAAGRQVCYTLRQTEIPMLEGAMWRLESARDVTDAVSYDLI